MANWISYIKDDLGSGDDTRDGMITNGPTHGVQLSQELPPLVGFTTIASTGTLEIKGTLKLDGQLKDGDDDFGTSGQVLSSDGTDTKWVSTGSLAAGAASQVAINDDGNTNAARFLTFVDSSSGNNNVKTDTQLTYNPSTNVISTSGVDVTDNSKIRFGNGNDLHISHTNDLSGQADSNGDDILAGDDWCSFIKETGSGPLIFKSNGGPSTGAYQFYDTGWRPILKLFSGTSARAALYYAGSEKLITSSTGITVTGTVAATAFSGPLTGNVTGNVSGNAGTATILQTARNIGGVSFDGSAAINLPGVNQSGNQNTSGNAATATVLATQRAFSISGDITANAINFNGNGDVTLSATIDDNVVDKNCMADEAVGEPELHISNDGTDGQFLQKQSGNSGGLTWADVTIPSAGTLSGSTLASGVTGSSITSLGTLGSLTVSGQTDLNGHVNIGDATNDTVSIVSAIDSDVTPDSLANSRSLGNSVQKWKTAYIETITGNLTGDVTGDVSGSSGSCTGNAATSSSCSGNAATSSSCSGNASTATTATNSNTSKIRTDSGDAYHNLVFVDSGSDNQNQTLKMDDETSRLQWNPHQENLVVWTAQIQGLRQWSDGSLGSSGQVLTSNAGNSWTWTTPFSGSYNDLSSKPTIPTNNNQLTNGANYISGSASNYQQFTSSGTWNKPSTGTVALVYVWGGGGGGAGGGTYKGGGGGGSYAHYVIQLSALSSSESVTVGSGGGGSSNGGYSRFKNDSYIAYGGQGGNGSSYSNQGGYGGHGGSVWATGGANNRGFGEDGASIAPGHGFGGYGGGGGAGGSGGHHAGGNAWLAGGGGGGRKSNSSQSGGDSRGGGNGGAGNGSNGSSRGGGGGGGGGSGGRGEVIVIVV